MRAHLWSIPRSRRTAFWYPTEGVIETAFKNACIHLCWQFTGNSLSTLRKTSLWSHHRLSPPPPQKKKCSNFHGNTQIVTNLERQIETTQMWFVFQYESINILEGEEGHRYKSFHKMDRKCSSRMRDAMFYCSREASNPKTYVQIPQISQSRSPCVLYSKY